MTNASKTKTQSAGSKMLAGLREALAVSQGEDTGAVFHTMPAMQAAQPKPQPG